MKQYYTDHLTEMVLCLLLTISLSGALYTGFYISDALASNILLSTVLSAVLILLLFTAAFGSKAGKTALILLILAGLAGLLWLHGNEVSIRDAEGSDSADYIFYIITYCVPIAVFLLTRTHWGTYGMAAVGILLIAAANYLEFPVRSYTILIYVFASLVMIMWRVSMSERGTGKSGKTLFAISISMVLCSLLAVGLAGGFYYAVIRALDPPVQSIRLLTKDMTPEIVERIGIADMYHIPDPDEVSNRVNDAVQNDVTPEEDPSGGNPDQSEDADTEDQDRAQQETKRAAAVNYRLLGLILLAGLAAAAMILAAGLGFLVWYNRMRRARMLAMDKREQVLRIYRYVFRNCRKLGAANDHGETPSEYAGKLTERFPQFTAEDVNFSLLAEVFSGVFYGQKDVTKEEYDACLLTFDRFHECCRKEKGWLRYLLLIH